MDDDIRSLITEPFDLGSLDKDVGWCAERYRLHVQDDGSIDVHRSGDQEGQQPWSERFVMRLETVDRLAGVVVLRGERHELVFDLRERRPLRSGYEPVGEIQLAEAPTESGLEDFLTRLAHLYLAAGLGGEGPVTLEAVESQGAQRSLRVRVGASDLLVARIAGERGLTTIDLLGAPSRRLDLHWSAGSPRMLRAYGGYLARSTYLGVRRAMIRGLG